MYLFRMKILDDEQYFQGDLKMREVNDGIVIKKNFVQNHENCLLGW